MLKRSLPVWGVGIAMLAAVPFWEPAPPHRREVRETLASATTRWNPISPRSDSPSAGNAAANARENSPGAGAPALSERVGALDAEIAELRSELRRAQEEISSLRASASRDELHLLDERVARALGETQASVEERFARIDGSLVEGRMRAEEASARFARFETLLQRDRDAMERTMMRPIVRLSGSNTVGSGIVIAVRRSSEKDRWNNFVLTSYHVVRDILLDARGDRRAEIKLGFYGTEGPQEATGDLLAYEETLDLALLVVSREEPWPHVATFASAEEERVTDRFTSVYAVGCPLGNDPIPTHGEILSRDHRLEGQSFWMISAPSYFGNSGGGVFAAESRNLIGIFSKIYTHGRSFPTVVPHMGLLTPASVVREWMKSAGHGDLIGA
ncbi:MAG: trypsin-like peptidase domain-containing protein [Planctomycetes bacterium]|nr:trypsin-like peptidase domain-containing protein [Planctomycetota bacterium]